MSWLIYTAAFLWAFWALYVLVMGIYRAHLDKRLSRAAYVLGLPWVVLGYVVDIVVQYTLASLLFAEWPRRGEHLVTDRLQRYMATGHGVRYRKAKWICEHLLDPFDPTGKHC